MDLTVSEQMNNEIMLEQLSCFYGSRGKAFAFIDWLQLPLHLLPAPLKSCLRLCKPIPSPRKHHLITKHKTQRNDVK